MILQLLPESFRKSWCIAGGFAACPALASDIDVWVYGRTNLEESRATILAYLESLLPALNVNKPVWAEKRYRFEPQEDASNFVPYEHTRCTILKVAVVESPANDKVQPIHIMVTDAPDPGTILQGFDVSTHAVGVDYSGRVWRHNGWTAPNQVPVELLSNARTPERLAKIGARFGHYKLTEETIGDI